MNIPQNLGELSPEELAALEGELQSNLTLAVMGGTGESDEARTAAVHLSAVTAELDRREQLADLAVSVRDAVIAELSANDGDEDVEDVEDADAERTNAPDPVAEAVAEEATSGAEDALGNDVDDDATIVETPSASELAGLDNVEDAPAGAPTRRMVLVTSVAERAAGTELANSVELADVLHEVARGMSNGDSRKIARFETPAPVQLGNDPIENTQMIQEMIDERGRDAEALVASGGWMTPSEISYQFFRPETMAGLLDLPTVGVNRGGLRVITNGGPQIGDALTTGSSAFWVWDETTDITPGSTVKTRYKIPGVSWTDVRLAAYGVALDHGNLAARAFPELTARWLQLAPVAHEHEINRIFIQAIEDASTDVDLSTGFESGGATATILGTAEIEADRIRQTYRMEQNAVIEAVFPYWVPDAIRADLSRRQGWNGSNVSNAEIYSYFTTRGIRPQFVYDWQHLPSNTKGYEGTASTAKMTYLMYPAGVWVKGQGGSLDLGVTRDSTLNETNDFTQLWTEQFLSLMKMGPVSKAILVNVQTHGFVGGVYETGS